MRRASPIPPPVWFLGSLGLMALLHLEMPGPEVVPAPWNLAGLVPMVGGWLLHLAAWRALRSADVSLDEIVPPPRLVTGGLFRHTRNPMYAAGVMILIGFAVFLGTAGGVVGAFVFPWVAGRRFVKTEEAVLEDRFGEEYRAYRRRVRRWV